MDAHFDQANLKELPEKLGEVWQVHAKRISVGSDDWNVSERRWCILVVSVTTDSLLPDNVIVSVDIVDEFPTPDLLWEKLERAIVAPRRGHACRPSAIEFRFDGYWDALQTRLASIGIKARCNDRCRCWESMFSVISAGSLLPEMHESLFDVIGVSSESMRRFFVSAASFYEQFSLFPANTTIEIQRDGHPDVRWCGLVSRQFSGKPCLRLVEAECPAKRRFSSFFDMLRHSVSLSVSFGSRDQLAPYDRLEIESSSWPIASSNAYPMPRRTNPGGTVRSLLGWELDLLERALHIIPGLLILQQRTHPESSRADRRMKHDPTFGHPVLTISLDRRIDDSHNG